jgi:hypothetical protein
MYEYNCVELEQRTIDHPDIYLWLISTDFVISTFLSRYSFRSILVVVDLCGFTLLIKKDAIYGMFMHGT